MTRHFDLMTDVLVEVLAVLEVVRHVPHARHVCALGCLNAADSKRPCRTRTGLLTSFEKRLIHVRCYSRERARIARAPGVFAFFDGTATSSSEGAVSAAESLMPSLASFESFRSAAFSSSRLASSSSAASL